MLLVEAFKGFLSSDEGRFSFLKLCFSIGSELECFQPLLLNLYCLSFNCDPLLLSYLVLLGNA